MAKRSLGRGLGAILEEVERAYETNKSEYAEYVQELDVGLIEPNPFQPRKEFSDDSLKELGESIQNYGLLQPIIVYEEEGRYILIAGERRLRASKLAGLSTIKTIVAEIDTRKLRELALIENIQREELSPIELATAYKELLEGYGLTHEELSKMIHKSRTLITNTLRLLSLSDYTKAALRDGRITQGHAKVLIGLDEPAQKVAVDSVVGQRLNVRELERMMQSSKGRTPLGKRPREGLSGGDTKSIDLSSLNPFFEKLREAGIHYRCERQGLFLSLRGEADVQKLSNLLFGGH